MKKHQKHSKLIKRNFGNYGPNEIAILGTSCAVISDLVKEVSKPLSVKNKIAYLDASHKENPESLKFDWFTYHHLGNLELEAKSSLNTYRAKNQLASYDLTFINGNHFQGAKQIIFLDKNKENAIIKRIDEIQDVLAFIQKDEIEIFDVLKSKFPNYKEIPSFKLTELVKLQDLVSVFLKENLPPLNGLILAGGESTRMGQDKASLKYYGKEHSLYILDMLKPYVENNFLSKKENKEKAPNIIADQFFNLGPFGAICSAFMHNPNKAYLVFATDLPYINKALIEKIITQRDPSKLATAVKGKKAKFPEPLICIWEPKAYPVLLQYLSQGISCPRKILINEDIKILEVDDKYITNVNNNIEYQAVLKALK